MLTYSRVTRDLLNNFSYYNREICTKWTPLPDWRTNTRQSWIFFSKNAENVHINCQNQLFQPNFNWNLQGKAHYHLDISYKHYLRLDYSYRARCSVFTTFLCLLLHISSHLHKQVTLLRRIYTLIQTQTHIGAVQKWRHRKIDDFGTPSSLVTICH